MGGEGQGDAASGVGGAEDFELEEHFVSGAAGAEDADGGVRRSGASEGEDADGGFLRQRGEACAGGGPAWVIGLPVGGLEI